MACLRMAAAYMGHEVSEETLLELLDFEATPLHLQRDGSLVWGDPNRGFIGNIDGWQIYYGGLREHPPTRRHVWWWGYGVYPKAIAEVATSLGLAAYLIDSLDDVYWHLDRGRPVIPIVPADGVTETVRWSWHTESGDRVPVINREHSVVLQPRYDQDRLAVNDPMLNRRQQIHDYTHGDFARAFSLLSMAVAIGRQRRLSTVPERVRIE